MSSILFNFLLILKKHVFPTFRISALDPAFPGFYGLFLKHITHDDAEFVDIIHTDAWRYGAPEDSGTVDFWPNGGKSLQPGCPPRGFKMLTDNGKFY